MDMTMKDYVNWKMSHDIKYGETEGYPLVLEKCRKNKELKDFKIYGNSVQESENLFDESTTTNGIYIDDTGVETASETSFLSDYISVIGGATYTVKVTNATSGTVNLRVNFFDSEKAWVSQTRYSTSTGTTSKTFTAADGISYVRVSYIVSGISTIYRDATPDNPIEVQSVGELTTKNLFDVSLLLTTAATLNGITAEPYGMGGVRVYGTPTVANTLINIRVDKKYECFLETGTVLRASRSLDSSYNNITGGCTYGFQVGTYDESNNWIVNLSNTSGSKTLSKDMYYMKTLNILITPKDTETYIDFVFNPQVEIGNTATEYEPYHKYKIPVTARGKNILDIDACLNTVLTKNEDGTYTLMKTSSNRFSETCSIFIPAGTSIALGVDVIAKQRSSSLDFNGIPCQFFFADGSGTTRTVYDNSTGVHVAIYDKDIVKIRPYLQIDDDVGDYITFKNIQIELGGEATDYEPYIEPKTFDIYLDEPLRKLGDYADYIDFEKGVVVRKCVKKYLKDYSWGESTHYESHVCYVARDTSILPTYEQNDSSLGYCYSDYFKSYWSANTYVNISNGIHMFSWYLNIRVTISNEFLSETSLEGFKTWLNENNPYMIRILAESIVETINLPELPKIQSKTTIYEVIDTTIEPSNMYGKYVKKY